VRQSGPGVVDRVGLSLWRQRVEVLRLALLDGIDPRDYYRLGLFDPAVRARRWDYVFDQEAAAFHRSRDRAAPESDGSGLAFLSDKLSVERELRALGIRTVETLAVLPEGSGVDGLPLGVEPVFCKRRAGSGALGAFELSGTEQSVCVKPVFGKPLTDDEALVFAEQALSQHEYLAQRLCRTHPALAGLGNGASEATTLRVISEARASGVLGTCAFLEVPVRSVDRRGFVPVSVDLGDGTLDRVVIDAAGPGATEVAEAIRSAREGGGDLAVPDWDATVAAVSAAHQSVGGVFSIAWDFVPTDAGPVLLEGNSTWGTVVPQRINGPFLGLSEAGAR